MSTATVEIQLFVQNPQSKKSPPAPSSSAMSYSLPHSSVLNPSVAPKPNSPWSKSTSASGFIFGGVTDGIKAAQQQKTGAATSMFGALNQELMKNPVATTQNLNQLFPQGANFPPPVTDASSQGQVESEEEEEDSGDEVDDDASKDREKRRPQTSGGLRIGSVQNPLPSVSEIQKAKTSVVSGAPATPSASPPTLSVAGVAVKEQEAKDKKEAKQEISAEDEDAEAEKSDVEESPKKKAPKKKSSKKETSKKEPVKKGPKKKTGKGAVAKGKKGKKGSKKSKAPARKSSRLQNKQVPKEIVDDVEKALEESRNTPQPTANKDHQVSAEDVEVEDVDVAEVTETEQTMIDNRRSEEMKEQQPPPSLLTDEVKKGEEAVEKEKQVNAPETVVEPVSALEPEAQSQEIGGEEKQPLMNSEVEVEVEVKKDTAELAEEPLEVANSSLSSSSSSEASSSSSSSSSAASLPESTLATRMATEDTKMSASPEGEDDEEEENLKGRRPSPTDSDKPMLMGTAALVYGEFQKNQAAKKQALNDPAVNSQAVGKRKRDFVLAAATAKRVKVSLPPVPTFAAVKPDIQAKLQLLKSQTQEFIHSQVDETMKTLQGEWERVCLDKLSEFREWQQRELAEKLAGARQQFTSTLTAALEQRLKESWLSTQ